MINVRRKSFFKSLRRRVVCMNPVIGSCRRVDELPKRLQCENARGGMAWHSGQWVRAATQPNA